MLVGVLPVGSVGAATTVEPIAELKPSAITEDISGIKGDEVAVPIAGSTGITSLAAHANTSANQINISLNEEGGEKFVRFTNDGSYTYSQLYINLDPAVFTGGGTYYFSISFRLNDGYTCTDSNGRAVLARLVDNNQNNYTVVSNNDLAANDYTDWTTSEFSIIVDQAPKVLRLIIFAEPGDYIDVKSLAIYDQEPVASGSDVLADLDPAAITEDISGINGDHEQTPVAITGSTGIVSLAGHAAGGDDGITVSLKEEGGDKFIRVTNTETCGAYSQLYINLDPAVFTGGGTYYFSLTFRLNDGHTCTDPLGRAVLARLVDDNQNNFTVVSGDDLASGDYTEWTTVNFAITADKAPTVLRLLTLAAPEDYIDVKSLVVYDKAHDKQVTATGISGTITWTLYSDGELSFSGKGAMPEFASASARPWHGYAGSIKSVTVGADVSFIDDLSFYQCNALTDFKVDAANTYYRAVNGVLFNKDKTLLHTYPAGNTQTSYTIPEGVTDIGGCAFYGAADLTEIKLPSTLLTIGEKAFANCTKITEIELPEGLRVIFGYAFYGCSSLAEVDIPHSVALIGGQAFRGCSALTKAVVNGPYAILVGEYVFGGTAAGFELHGYTDSTADTYASTYGHTFVSLGDIPEGAVPPALASGTCGASLTWTLYSDGELVISGSGTMTDWNSAEAVPWHIYRSYIKTAVIENGVTSIGESSFNGTSTLTSVEIPASVTWIETAPFFECDALVSISVAEESTSFCDVDGVLFTKDKTTILRYPSAKAGTSYTVPSEVTTIGCNAFLIAPLSSIVLPSNLKTIVYYAFQNCDDLTSIEIPASVQSIGEGAFRLSSNLESVKVHNPTAVFGENVFEYVADNFALHGYAGSTAETYAEENGHTFVALPVDNAVATVGNDEGKAGETVTLDITLEKAAKLGSIAISDITYDSNVLEFVSFEWKLDGTMLASFDTATGKGAAAFENDEDANGVIGTLTFKIKENAADGDYAVSCNIQGKANNEDYDISDDAGTVTVHSVISGDTDGDGEVSKDDAVYLMMSLFFEDTYPITQDADYNGDGDVNKDDAVYLLMHIFFEDIYPLN